MKHAVTDFETAQDILSLVGKVLTKKVYDSWTREQIETAVDWASACHLHASDNPVRGRRLIMPKFVETLEEWDLEEWRDMRAFSLDNMLINIAERYPEHPSPILLFYSLASQWLTAHVSDIYLVMARKELAHFMKKFPRVISLSSGEVRNLTASFHKQLIQALKNAESLEDGKSSI